MIKSKLSQLALKYVRTNYPKAIIGVCRVREVTSRDGLIIRIEVEFYQEDPVIGDLNNYRLDVRFSEGQDVAFVVRRA